MSFYEHPQKGIRDMGYYSNLWRYSGPKDWLHEAENMMHGRGQADCLWRKREERARKLIWC